MYVLNISAILCKLLIMSCTLMSVAFVVVSWGFAKNRNLLLLKQKKRFIRLLYLINTFELEYYKKSKHLLAQPLNRNRIFAVFFF